MLSVALLVALTGAPDFVVEVGHPPLLLADLRRSRLPSLKGANAYWLSGGSIAQPTPPVADASVIILVLAGQSNATGVSGVPIQTTTAMADFNNCQAGATNAIEVIEEDAASNCWSNAESPTAGLVYALRSRITHTASIIAVRCGVSGSAINTWDPAGTGNNYDACITAVTAMEAEVAANAATYNSDGTSVVIGVHWWQGESDEATAEGTYRALFDAVVTNFDTDIKVVTSQTQDVDFFTEIPMTFSVGGGEVTPTGPVLAQTASCIANDNVICVNTNMHFEPEVGGSQLHKNGPGHRLSGELMGAAQHSRTFGGGFTEFFMTSCDAAGTALTVGFDLPVGPILIDIASNNFTLGQGSSDYGCGAHPGGSYGIEVEDDTGFVAVTSVATSGSTGLTGTLARVLGTNPMCRIGWRAASVATGVFGCEGVANNNPYSNISDSSAVPASYFALPRELAITVTGGSDAGVADDGAVDTGDDGVPADDGITDDGIADDGIADSGVTDTGDSGVAAPTLFAGADHVWLGNTADCNDTTGLADTVGSFDVAKTAGTLTCDIATTGLTSSGTYNAFNLDGTELEAVSGFPGMTDNLHVRTIIQSNAASSNDYMLAFWGAGGVNERMYLLRGATGNITYGLDNNGTLMQTASINCPNNEWCFIDLYYDVSDGQITLCVGQASGHSCVTDTDINNEAFAADTDWEIGAANSVASLAVVDMDYVGMAMWIDQAAFTTGGSDTACQTEGICP